MPRLDRFGDPLPAGAVARLGTSYLRAGTSSLTFAPDGKTLRGVDGRSMRVWDAGNGKLLDTRSLSGMEWPRIGTSGASQTAILHTRTTIEIWDLHDVKRVVAGPPGSFTQIARCAVSRDRSLVVLTNLGTEKSPVPARGLDLREPNHQLTIWDTRTGQTKLLADSEPGVASLDFSPDGTRCVSSGGRVTCLWDTTTGRKLWHVPEFNAELTRFTPDGKVVIAAPGAGQNRWHVWDAETGKPASGCHPPEVGYVWDFAVSPDGRSLLIPTESDYILWDLHTGRVRQRWPGARQAGRGVFAPDGRSVVTHDTVLRRWDVATGKPLYPEVTSRGHTAPVRRMFFSPDGNRLVSVGDDRTIRVWNPASSELLRTIRLDGLEVDPWALSPAGDTLIGVDERLCVHRWSLATGQPGPPVDLRDAQKLDIGLRPRDVRIGTDGTLTLLAWPRLPEYRLTPFSFSFWEASTGRLLRWGGDPGRDYRGDYARLSPDGRLVANTEGLFDTRSGESRSLPASPIGMGGMPVFSPDGRLLAAGGANTRVWEAATARVLVDLPRGIGTIDQLTFSPDGRRLACLASDRVVLWDLAGGKLLTEYPVSPALAVHSSWLSGGMVFSPDGTRLATGFVDGTILLWEVPSATSEGRWSEAEAEALMTDLADELPANAYPAVWHLAGYPAEAVRFLREQYPPVPPVSEPEVGRMIAALDSARFAEREAASRRLRQFGRPTVHALRQALKDSPTPEQVRRIEALLADLDPARGRLRGDDFRAIRAVAVVEASRTTEGWRLLSDWAARGPTPRLAEEAARALDRQPQPLPGQ